MNARTILTPGILALVAVLSGSPVYAQQAPWLPSDDAVRLALEHHPAISDAIALREARDAGADATRVGSHETLVRVTPQGRWTRNPAEAYPEMQIAVERPLRLYGKAQADGALADAAQASASVALQDARHELSRLLLTLWFATARSQAETESLRAAQKQVETLAATVAARLRQGDAAELDRMLAQADVQRAQAASLAAQAALEAAQAELGAQFPDVGMPTVLPTELPAASSQDAGALRRQYVSGSHEVLLAHAEADRYQLQARRVDLERHPDPIIGAFATVERSASERIVGMSLSIPLGGTYRNAQAREAAAQASAAAARSSQAERKAQAEFGSLWASLQGARQTAAALGEAASSQEAAAAKMTRAYSLGEAGITETLTAQRSAAEADRQWRAALIDAVQLNTRLKLDLHQMWDFD
jgi:outer membrane protein TolC